MAKDRFVHLKCGKTLKPELVNTFKAECSRRGTTMTKMLSKLIRKWLTEVGTL